MKDNKQSIILMLPKVQTNHKLDIELKLHIVGKCTTSDPCFRASMLSFLVP